VLVSSDRTGVFNVWAVPLDGGPPEHLTTLAIERAGGWVVAAREQTSLLVVRAKPDAAAAPFRRRGLDGRSLRRLNDPP
jgi:hypothetical protein